MDLALELGMSVSRLSSEMTLGELHDWRLYQRKRLLPGHRVEMYLAQLARQQGGGSLSDYFIRTEQQDAQDIASAAVALSEMAGGLKIIRVKKKS